jgi:hypothetical protein
MSTDKVRYNLVTARFYYNLISLHLDGDFFPPTLFFAININKYFYATSLSNCIHRFPLLLKYTFFCITGTQT